MRLSGRAWSMEPPNPMTGSQNSSNFSLSRS